jgi:uncharacterized protein (TIGR02217 family)
MSVSQFPVLPGLGWPLNRKEIWQSSVERSVAGLNTGYQEKNFGTGDGVTTVFQLVRSFGGFVEPVFALSGTPTIKVAGTGVGSFSVDNYGNVTFASAPANGAALTWTGQFLYYCRFDSDELEIEQMMAASAAGGGGLHTVKKITFTTEKFSA